jgi:pimeloyl-ACP methyl ester carboxylesterase
MGPQPHRTPESGTEPFTYVGDMATVLRTLQVNRAYLAGIADGANLALEYCLDHPHQVEAVAFVGPNIPGYVPTTISPEAEARVAEVFSLMTSATLGATLEERLQNFIEAGLSMAENALERPETRERMRAMATENGQRLVANPEWIHLRTHAWREPPVFQRLSEIHVPTLIVVQRPLQFDALQYIEALSQAIAGAKVALIPAESTMINLNQPEAFNRIVLDFLGAIDQSQNL